MYLGTVYVNVGNRILHHLISIYLNIIFISFYLIILEREVSMFLLYAYKIRFCANKTQSLRRTMTPSLIHDRKKTHTEINMTFIDSGAVERYYLCYKILKFIRPFSCYLLFSPRQLLGNTEALSVLPLSLEVSIVLKSIRQFGTVE